MRRKFPRRGEQKLCWLLDYKTKPAEDLLAEAPESSSPQPAQAPSPTPPPTPSPSPEPEEDSSSTRRSSRLSKKPRVEYEGLDSEPVSPPHPPDTDTPPGNLAKKPTLLNSTE